MWVSSQPVGAQVYLLQIQRKDLKIQFTRSKPFNPSEKDGGGYKFVLFAFVNDVKEDVDEGMDNVEHM